jgi:hypothetical protein
MKFADGRQINKIQIPIVRICNRKCPHCCARDQLTWFNRSLDKGNEISLDEIRRAGSLIGKIEQIEITGGEPTMHSHFEELSNNLSNIFQCDDVMLVSNGFLFGKDPTKLPLLLKFKRIWISHYTDTFVDQYRKSGSPNSTTVALIKDFLEKENHSLFDIVTMNDHVPFNPPPYVGKPCHHYNSHMISYYEGKLFGCCVAWSLPDQGEGITLTAELRTQLSEIDIPCENCFLSKN